MVYAFVICDKTASFASVVFNMVVDCDIVVSSRMLVVISEETVCHVLDFNNSFCVSGEDGVPDVVDSSDDLPMFLGDVTRVVVGAMDADRWTARCRVVVSRVLRTVVS